jgi:uncharacterized protein DUF1801
VAAPKTQRNDSDVADFLAGVADERRRADSERLCELFAEVSGAPARMWGSSIVGFGASMYRLADGKTYDWFSVGFSPRKQNLALYLIGGLAQNADLLDQLGKHKVGKSCLYVNRLTDVDAEVLRQLAARSVVAANEQTAALSNP